MHGHMNVKFVFHTYGIKVNTQMYLMHVMPSVTRQSNTKDLKDSLKCKESEPVSFMKNILKLQI
jgi:hypothetical protein